MHLESTPPRRWTNTGWNPNLDRSGQQQKDKTIPLVERASRTHKSMDRLESTADRRAECQANDEMRKELSTRVAVQRRNIEMPQVSSCAENAAMDGTLTAVQGCEGCV